jgi:hypothetical protein
LGSRHDKGDVDESGAVWLRKGAHHERHPDLYRFRPRWRTAAVFISYLFERISNFTSLMVFFGLFVLVFYVAWKPAVLVTERFIVRQTWSPTEPVRG